MLRIMRASPDGEEQKNKAIAAVFQASVARFNEFSKRR